MRQLIQQLLNFEELNFLLTNRLPRRWLTQCMAWFSKIEQPLVRDASIAVWKFFCDVDLSDAKSSSFRSMHDCFTRQLAPGARTIDPRGDVLTSPCDAIVGACGTVQGHEVFQAKGFPYRLEDLLGADTDFTPWRDGTFVTLRLTAGMYHRFHAAHDCVVEEVRYFSGDTWNVNPIALRRVEKLFCKNERVLVQTRLTAPGPLVGKRIALVPVAAILVASIRLHFLDTLLHLKYRGPQVTPCNARYAKGDELGYFQHGSTVLVFAPKGFSLCSGVQDGFGIRMGQPLMRWVDSGAP